MIMRDAAGRSVPEESSSDRDLDEEESGDTQLVEKIGELTHFIDKTIKTISQFSAPMSATAEQLPDATAHLKDLRKLTEDGTHKIMQLVEAIEENRKRANIQFEALVNGLASSDPATVASKITAIRATLAADNKPLMDILTALSFQDLVAQSVNKLVTIIDDVEHKLLEMVVVFGPYTKGAGMAEAGKASEMLKQLSATKNSSMKQDLADEILKQYGFN
ncbi:MAG: protein phosphatase CheZ [Nitrospirota bacterium]|nr:protein phosphatase CheZ [Nitrospirota bacterium]MDP2383794.1 protein phosphatase CheZ [Nitrospirota bacterium]MDP3599460.1 protein phosphatase CheZ [Nitrospirota bacterium]